MKYFNAKKGLKKVYISQVFAIIAAVLSSLTVLFIGLFKIGFADSVAASVLEFAVLTFAFGLSMIIMVILTNLFGIIGYFQAAKDEPEFRKAMLCMIASGALVIIGSVFQLPNGTLYTIFTSAGTIVEMFVMVFSISGIIKISDSFENTKMSGRGDFLLKVLVATYIISSIDTLIVRIFELSDQAKIVSVILDVIDLALIVLRYVLYLRYLRAAMRMITENDADGLRS